MVHISEVPERASHDAHNGSLSISSARNRRSSPVLSPRPGPAQATQSISASSSTVPTTARREGKTQRPGDEHSFSTSISGKRTDDNTPSSPPSPSSFDETDDEVNHDDDDDYYDQRLNTTTTSLPPSSKDLYTADEERKVIHKLDRRLTLFLSFLYLLSFLDRSNIGNAKIAGLQASLDIDSAQFDLTLLAFYVTYITFEWMILLYRLVPAHIYISGCVFAWGLVACLQSTVTSFKQLLALRALLGVTEAAFGPGVPFYMTFFYRREELAYRVGLQISAAPLATSFASSLAWVIVKLSEGGPLESWRALFLFEGFPSLIVAVFAWYFIPDGPGSARWLTRREREVAVARLRGEKGRHDHDGDSGSHKDREGGLFKSKSKSKSNKSATSNTGAGRRPSGLNRADLLATLLDPKSYMTALMFLSVNVSFASLPVFLPTIINSMSFSPLTSQILAAPPYLISFFFVLLIARASDRIPNSRSVFLACSASLSCASYTTIAVVGALHDHVSPRISIVIRYVAVYGAACGLFASVVLIITWTLNNQRSATGKGAGMVILNVVGQCGPLIGVELFPGRDGPFFVKGMGVCAGFMAVVVILALGLRGYLSRLNEIVVGGGRGRRGDELGGYEMVRLGENERSERFDGDAEEDENGEGEEDEEARTLVGGENEDGHNHDPRQKDGKEFRYML